jgi:glycosyltransferase involved in cell wall biosynthesis
MTQDAATSGAAARGTTVYLNGNAGEELVKKGLLKPEGLKIGLIGSCTPPYTGVTVHVHRLMKKLDDVNVDWVLYDILGVQREHKEDRVVCVKYPKLWMVKYFFSTKHEIIHNHTEDWRGQVIVGLMGLLGQKTIATLHSEALIDSWNDYNFIKRKLIQLALKSTTSLIVVNANIREFCLSIGIDPDKIFLIPAFIPPAPENEEVHEIPGDIRDFLDSHYPVLSANAFKIIFFKGEDVYGIDLCIDLCYNLKKTWNNIGLIFFLPEFLWGEKERQHFSYLQERLIELNLQNNFLFVTQSYPFHPVLLKSSIFVRPTNTDGDAISIREALYFKIPSVASNVVTRPDGTIVFKNRDIDDFTVKVKDLLDNYQVYKQRLNSLTSEDYAARIVHVYQKVAGMSETAIAD